MVIKDDKRYYRRDLEKYLKWLKLPHSHPTIIKYENDGVIPKMDRLDIGNGRSNPRYYTGKQIKKIAQKIREFENKK